MNKNEEEKATQPLSGEISMSKDVDKGSKVYATLISRDTNIRDIDLSCNDEIVIGRHKDCNIIIKEGTISGKHCIITPILNEGDSEPEFFIKDLSTNGTFLNSTLIGKNKTRKLMSTDEVSFAAPTIKRKNKNENLCTFIFTPKKNNKLDMIGKYQLTQILGTGNFSVVREGINTDTGESYAIKIMDKHKFSSTQMSENMKREILILRKLQHPNIVSVIDIIDNNKNLYIVLELAKGGELFDRIMEKEKFSEEEARQMFKQLLDAVSYLHSKNIVHRDLKPENILLDNKKDNTIKITDFGLARIVGNKQMMQTQCGTPHYVAPEILNLGNNSFNGSNIQGYGKEVDSWSLGVILYILLTGCPPWDSDENDDEVHIFKQIKSGIVTFPQDLFKDVSPSAIDLIKQLLTFDPSKRLSVEDALLHDWILNINKNTKGKHLIGSNMKRLHSIIKPDPCSPRKRKLTADTEDTEIDKENDVNIKRGSSNESHKKRSNIAPKSRSNK
eukprot:TRINITY_DN7037_c0_g3_i1.p1 TRINITY_DN7037_c0_g3~~TRINITY_DN7037_c0_g3_i1.p1  ORF type:complete len:512 (-),score=119.45 TRINITY_DN7037_c0_g3_i1:124-1626(-)